MNSPVHAHNLRRSASFTQRPNTPPNVVELVASVLDVVAPQWPLATFAARSPWHGWERQPFSQAAREHQALTGISMLPAPALARQRWHHGDLQAEVLTTVIDRWLRQRGERWVKTHNQQFVRRLLTDDGLLLGSAMSRYWQQLATTLPAPVRPRKIVVTTVGQRLAALGQPQVQQLIDQATIRWCKLALGQNRAAWPCAGSHLFASWRHYAELDPLLPREARRRLAECPTSAAPALHWGLQWAADQVQQRDYLKAELLALPGWAGTLRYHGRQQGDELSSLVDYLAVRLALSRALTGDRPPATSVQPADSHPLLKAWAQYGLMSPWQWQRMGASDKQERLALAAALDDETQAMIWLECMELDYRQRLQRLLDRSGENGAPLPRRERPLAQLVMCIDVRSEPLRRALEHAGPFTTHGYAGFFGLPLRSRSLNGDQVHAACPVILKPLAEVGETAPPLLLRHYRQQWEDDRNCDHAEQQIKDSPLASLTLPELSGLWHGAQLLWQGLVPSRWRTKLTAAMPRRIPLPVGLALHQQGFRDGLPLGLSLEQRVTLTAQALRGIGLTRDFAPLVVIVGHGSRSRNNPYAAKLECGACGGAAGGFNARVLAALANEPAVRAGLAAEGIAIATETVFVAAEHQTALDQLQLLEPPPLHGAAEKSWRQLEQSLPAALATVRHERLAQLPDIQRRPPLDSAESWRRTDDWSEVRPEWGLVGNAAIIIAERSFTAGHNLGARVFLHNYPWQTDVDGSLLAGIVSGPVTVAQWINLQYYASTVAPQLHGSGSKTTQTITDGLGVMQGNGSDLLAGLPWQSVMASDSDCRHLPQRLLVVIQAPRARIDQLLASHADFRRKVTNGWLLLTSHDPQTGEWSHW
ncbi:MAG: DUF2309 family protein [Gammaproteobacteria bacterium]|nr:DUF2309 family protein [Gammaproteobacteria bacterium]